MTNTLPHLAVFVDIENLDRPQSLDFSALLKHLRSLGRVTVCRAYADWAQTPDIRRVLTQAGIELVDMAALNGHGKNATDIRVAVDAIELAHTQPEISQFVIVSGDSDFVPLIVRLRSYQKLVTLIADGDKAARAAKSFCDELLDFPSIPGFAPAALPTAKSSANVKPSARTRDSHDSTEALAEIIGKLQTAGEGAPLGSVRVEWSKRMGSSAPGAFIPLLRRSLVEGLVQPTRKRSATVRFRQTPRHERKTAAMVHSMLTESAYRLLQRAILQMGAENSASWGQLKPVVQRIAPNFHEGRLGFQQFGELIQAAHDAGYIETNAADSDAVVQLPKPAEVVASECARWHLRRAIPRDPWAAVSVLLSVKGIVLQAPELHRALLRAIHDALRGLEEGLSRGQLQSAVRKGFFQGAAMLHWRRVFAELLHGLLQLDMLIECHSAHYRLPKAAVDFETWKLPLDQLMTRCIGELDISFTQADWESLQLGPSIPVEETLEAATSADHALQQRTFAFCAPPQAASDD